MNMVFDGFLRAWENFLARPDGPMSLRFILQPSIAVIMAVKAGVNDARQSRPAYLWSIFTNSEGRRELLRNGFKDMRTTFLISVILDIIYQLALHRWVYPFEVLLTAAILALMPYLIVRGPVNRLARLWLVKNEERK